MNHKRNKKRNQTMHRNEWKWKHNNPKPMGHLKKKKRKKEKKSSAKGKVHSITGFPQERRKKLNK